MWKALQVLSLGAVIHSLAIEKITVCIVLTTAQVSTSVTTKILQATVALMAQHCMNVLRIRALIFFAVSMKRTRISFTLTACKRMRLSAETMENS